MRHLYKFLLLTILVCSAGSGVAYAQNYLQKKVTIHVSKTRVQQVLKQIEQQGKFYFSYNSRLLNGDSLVSITARNQTVVQVLHLLFGNRFRYQQTSEHVIILAQTNNTPYVITGIVTDGISNQPIADATVYQGSQLISTITDASGKFRLQLRQHNENDLIVVSKVGYTDSVFNAPLSSESHVNIALTKTIFELDSVKILPVERNWLARNLIPAKQIVNSVNLNNFFARQPFQFSLTPGLGSHGKMGAQVVNKFSLNVVGGYTAGVNGFELGTLFNIVKKDVRHLQIAGLFNMVGGNVRGVQIGGVYNANSGYLNGVQVGGVINTLGSSIRGIQVGGLGNITRGSKGIQIGGLGNYVTGDVRGIQIGGILNTGKNVKGLQITGLLNRAKNLSGLQVGVINIADTNKGYSIGIVNISKTGYHKVSLSYNEMLTLMLSYKSGNPKLYSILTAGSTLDRNQKAFALGYGLGSDLSISKMKWFINPELIQLYYYNGNMSNQHHVSRLQTHLKYRFHKSIAMYAGPAFTFHYFKNNTPTEGYKTDIGNGLQLFRIGNHINAWIGWNVGIDLF